MLDRLPVEVAEWIIGDRGWSSGVSARHDVVHDRGDPISGHLKLAFAPISGNHLLAFSSVINGLAWPLNVNYEENAVKVTNYGVLQGWLEPKGNQNWASGGW
jgi:hypothetical protein